MVGDRLGGRLGTIRTRLGLMGGTSARLYGLNREQTGKVLRWGGAAERDLMKGMV